VHFRFVMILGIMLAVSSAFALQFDETIKAPEQGTLYTQTNGGGTGDMTQGTGDISYTRSITLDDGISALSSAYSLSNSSSGFYNGWGSFKPLAASKSGWKPIVPGFAANRYQIAMFSNHRIGQSLSLSGSDIFSNSRIDFKNQQVTTNYNIKATGILHESVFEGKSGKTNILADTSLAGKNFTLKSGLQEDVPIGSDVAMLLGQVDKTNMSGEKPYTEPATLYKAYSIAASGTIPADTRASGSSSAGENENELDPFTKLKVKQADTAAENCSGSYCTRNVSDDETDPWANANTMPEYPAAAPAATGPEKPVFLHGNATPSSLKSAFNVSYEGNNIYMTSSQCNGSGSMYCQDYVFIAYPKPGIGRVQAGALSARVGIIRKPDPALQGV